MRRLIDANALLEKLKKTDRYFNIKFDIENAPTIDAVEVVHGRWIAVPSSDMNIGHAFKCSECNKMRFGSHIPNYCPNCGAKMDGDGNG